MSVCESAILISMLMPHPKGKKEWEEREKEAHRQWEREVLKEGKKNRERKEANNCALGTGHIYTLCKLPRSWLPLTEFCLVWPGYKVGMSCQKTSKQNPCLIPKKIVKPCLKILTTHQFLDWINMRATWYPCIFGNDICSERFGDLLFGKSATLFNI